VFILRLSPLEVKKQEFKKTMRGYDPLEVDAFLEMLADELENINREKKQLSDEVMKLKIQLRDYQDVESTLRETLVTAQESVNESKENSRREADMMLREAELKAEKLLEDTKLRLAEMKNELVLVKAQKDSFARRLRHLLESQLDIIGVLEMDDLGFETPQSKRRHVQKQEAQAATPGMETKPDEYGMQEPQKGKAEAAAEKQQQPEQKEDYTDIEWKTRQMNIDEDKDDDDDQHNRISDQLII
jgi:cell division initiation protein